MTNPLYDSLFGARETAPTPFLHLPNGTTLSHAEFCTRAAALAAALTDQGLAPGDRVAVQVAKSADALALYAGCLRSGLVFLPLNTGYTTDELGYFVSDSGAKVMVSAPSDAEALRDVAASAGAMLMTLGTGGDGTLAELADTVTDPAPPVSRDPDDLAALLYTSGTTGRSKGAMLTQQNLLSNAQVLADSWRFTDTDVLLHALPIFHSHGLFVASNTVALTGGAMIFQPGFDRDAIFDALPRATSMMGVPTFYTRLLDDPRLTRAATGHIRLFTSGSAPLLAETHRAWQARTGHRILERYGMTETNMNASNPYEGERRPGSVGPALPGIEIRITSEGSDKPLPAGEIGQIEVRGPNVFRGYWNLPEKTAEELREDGFFITGDLGHIDADGYLTIVGRAKDLIISGGYNIYPKEIELVLDDQPGVLESAVIGVPHPDFGETPLGLIVATPGAAPDLDAIAAALTGKLARFKQPRALELIDALPRNTMGKVQKNLLREQFAARFSG